jgi:hypothetical protein
MQVVWKAPMRCPCCVEAHLLFEDGKRPFSHSSLAKSTFTLQEFLKRFPRVPKKVSEELHKVSKEVPKAVSKSS